MENCLRRSFSKFISVLNTKRLRGSTPAAVFYPRFTSSSNNGKKSDSSELDKTSSSSSVKEVDKTSTSSDKEVATTSKKELDKIPEKEQAIDDGTYYDEGATLPTPLPDRPFRRVYRLLREDFYNIKKGRFYTPETEIFPTFVDVAIIGSGIIGSSIAFWLKQRAAEGLNIVVIEKDPTFTRSSTSLSVGGLQQQFSVPEHIKMSLFGADFLRNIKKYLTVLDHDPPDVHFTPYGHLCLATESKAEDLKESYKLQKELGAQVELLTKTELKFRFPWLNTDGIDLACSGYGSEGWFDPGLLLKAYQRKAVSLGVKFLNAEVVGFTFERQFGLNVLDDDGIGQRAYERLSQTRVKTETGQVRSINAAYTIVAAGSESGRIGNMARIGTNQGMLSQPIPVEPRKRYVYSFHTFNGPGLDCPHVIDPSGVNLRRDGLGGNYVCSRPPLTNEEPDTTHLDVDYSYFENSILPILKHRIPSVGDLKLKTAWAGYYDYNTYDQGGIIGPHPYYPNLLIASGFNGFGVQQSPAIGRAITELILEGEFKTIDLSPFSFERFITDEPINERNVI